MARSDAKGTIFVGGIAFIGGTIAFLGVFSTSPLALTILRFLTAVPRMCSQRCWRLGPRVGLPGRSTVFFHWFSFQLVSVRSRPCASVLQAQCASECSSPCWPR